MGLSYTPVTVICSGAKSILDLPKTLDVLERNGVAVVGYTTDEFPAFYSHYHGIPLSQRLDSAEEVAKLMNFHRKLNINQGIVIANPIPLAAELTDEEMTPFIDQAHKEAQQNSGQPLTPFLLKRIAELSAGRSLEANNQLIKNNAYLGAQIANAYHKKILEKNTMNS
jgi:pseudouridine-5'-phosphate glycosidase